MKRLKYVVVMLIILACTFTLFACKKSDSNKDTGYKETVLQEELTGARVIFKDAVIDANTAIALDPTCVKVDFTQEEIKDLEEGLLSLLDLQIDLDYHQRTAKIYDRMGTVDLSDEEIAQGIRIVVFTSVDADKSTDANAKRINIGDYALVQAGKPADELTINDGTVLFVAKAQL